MIAHELGHNFGLAHAASLDCGANVIGGTCTSSEYGDPFDTMGNNRAMHFNSMQKNDLGWLPAGSVANHTTGTTTYTLSPLELGRRHDLRGEGGGGGESHVLDRIPAGDRLRRRHCPRFRTTARRFASPTHSSRCAPAATTTPSSST